MALQLVNGGWPDAVAFPLFNAFLDRTGRRQLQRLVTVFSASRGQIVARQGEVNRDLLVLASGVIKLSKVGPDGQRLIVAFRAPGDPISLQRSDTPWPATAQAVSDCTLCRVEWESLGRLANRYPAIHQALLDLASDEIASQQDRLLLLGRGTTEEKLASFILEYCQPARAPSSIGREIHLPMRRSEIAEYLALTTESVSRVFSRLKRDRIIMMRRPSLIVVLNRPALEAMAMGRQSVTQHRAVPAALESLQGSG